ncbi:MAG: hypothetical protein BRC53_10980 [Cyanobacteria bacterium SW_6_48_11]|nr:MAG: hypothetical protein BRC36_11045 [Cyanobacteria bacterium QH_2_48_84]PSO70744.1 MAG: hypothetical protein BRC37_15060 [Cyanobacteria bacterium QH_3_48_40]PSO95293.1 MAG: hypothetical protein BRC53_10980 [Cyanobacteria bacterium SW_6_48_11]
MARPESAHGLEIAEYVLTAAAVVGSAIAVATGQLAYLVALLLSIALLFNSVNRLRLKQLHTRQIEQVRGQFLRKLQSLEKEDRVAAMPPHSRSTTTVSEEQLASVERSLTNVVQYLNNASLSERVEHLEKTYAQLNGELAWISRQISENQEETSQQRPEQEQTRAQSQIMPSSESQAFSSSPQPPDVSPQPNRMDDDSSRAANYFSTTWNRRHTLTGHSDWVSSLAISTDGRFLASASWDKSLRLWELATGNLIESCCEHSQGLLAVSFHPDGSYLATGSFDQSIELWQIEHQETGEVSLSSTKTLTGHTGSVRSVAITPDGETLISGSYDQTLRQWKLDGGDIIRSWHDELGAIYAIAQTGQLLASGGGDGCITLWQLGSSEPLAFLKGNVDSVESLAIRPDGKVLAAGCVDGSIKFWQLDSDTFTGISHSPSAILQAHTGQVRSVIFTQDGQTLISGGADSKIKIWHPGSGESLAILQLASQSPERLNGLLSLALSPDERLLAAGSVEGTIEVWQRVEENSAVSTQRSH